MKLVNLDLQWHFITNLDVVRVVTIPTSLLVTRITIIIILCVF